jgi:hypothetical protein
MFKSNSRFAALAEDINNNIYSNKDNNKKDNNKRDNKKENTILPKETSFLKEENSFLKEESNSFKKDYQRRSNRDDRFETSEYKERIEKEEKVRKEKEEKRKESETKKNLAVENFPDLNKKVITCTPDKNLTNIKMDYIDKVATKKNIKATNKKLQELKPGHIEIQYDKENRGKIVYRYGKGVNPNLDMNMDMDNKDKTNYVALDALVNLHETRTQAYIAMWGYETWENMFIIPNYDYHFFDKLDEEYELQMQEEEEYDSENNEDYY